MKTLRQLAPIGLALLACTAWAANHGAKPAATKPAAAKPAAAAEQGRDWNRIDTNRDGLVSPEEMEAFLRDNPGPLRGK